MEYVEEVEELIEYNVPIPPLPKNGPLPLYALRMPRAVTPCHPPDRSCLTLEDYRQFRSTDFYQGEELTDEDAHTLYDLIKRNAVLWAFKRVKVPFEQWEKLAVDFANRAIHTYTVAQIRNFWAKAKRELRHRLSEAISKKLHEYGTEDEMYKWKHYTHMRFYRQVYQEYEDELKKKYAKEPYNKNVLRDLGVYDDEIDYEVINLDSRSPSPIPEQNNIVNENQQEVPENEEIQFGEEIVQVNDNEPAAAELIQANNEEPSGNGNDVDEYVDIWVDNGEPEFEEESLDDAHNEMIIDGIASADVEDNHMNELIEMERKKEGNIDAGNVEMLVDHVAPDNENAMLIDPVESERGVDDQDNDNQETLGDQNAPLVEKQNHANTNGEIVANPVEPDNQNTRDKFQWNDALFNKLLKKQQAGDPLTQEEQTIWTGFRCKATKNAVHFAAKSALYVNPDFLPLFKEAFTDLTEMMKTVLAKNGCLPEELSGIIRMLADQSRQRANKKNQAQTTSSQPGTSSIDQEASTSREPPPKRHRTD